MLVVQEVNRVKGKAMEQFESMTQELWNVAAATGVQAAWFFEVSHGTGPSYCVVTGMRLPDWAAWESFARAVAFGDLSGLTEALDATRYDSESSIAAATPASSSRPSRARPTARSRSCPRSPSHLRRPRHPACGCSASSIPTPGVRQPSANPGSSCAAASGPDPMGSRC